MKQREGRLVYGPDEQYTLRDIPLVEGDSLDIRVGKNWVCEYVHYEKSDGNLYCDSGIMPIPRYDGREADFAWRGFTTNKGMKRISREMTLMNSTKRMAWDTEEFEDEEEY